MLLVATVVRNKEVVCVDTIHRLPMFYVVWPNGEASNVLDCGQNTEASKVIDHMN